MQLGAERIPTSTSKPTTHHLIVLGRSAGGQPRSYHLASASASASASPRDAAYRRLAVAVLGLDIRTLARELRATRALGASVERG
jgi:hypothetical protein